MLSSLLLERQIIMKTWFKRSLLIGGTTVMLVGGLAACSHGMGGMSGMGDMDGHGRHGSAMSEADRTQMRARMLERAGKELELDAAQKQRLSTLADKMREQRDALMGGAAGNPRAELQALVAGATFDRAKALAMVEAKTNAVRAKSPELITAAADFYDSLRPEQQQKVRDFMNKRRGWGHRG